MEEESEVDSEEDTDGVEAVVEELEVEELEEDMAVMAVKSCIQRTVN